MSSEDPRPAKAHLGAVWLGSTRISAMMSKNLGSLGYNAFYEYGVDITLVSMG